METGTLYLCATPIGNLEDMTPRALRALSEASVVFAEDTRRTLQLLNHFQLRKPLVSCHMHNEQAREAQLIAELKEGRHVAYCSDAGMPGISDPGAKLVSACVKHGLPVTVLPGASAALTALVLSGLPCETFTFFGFLPRGKSERRAAMKNIADSLHTAILYESPVRVPATLRELQSVLGENREAAVLRELTKLHEEAVRGTLHTLSETFSEPPRGECVIVVAAAPKAAREETVGDDALREAVQKLLDAGFSPRDAALAAATVTNTPRKQAYRHALELTREDGA